MSSSLSILPLHYNIDFIVDKSNVSNHFGYEVKEDGIHFRYQTSDYESVIDAIDAYQIQYAAEVMKPTMLQNIAAIRWTKCQRFTYLGVDTWAHAALTDLCAAALDMMLDEDAGIASTPVPWKLAEGEWRLWSLEDLRQYGKAIRIHVQACFNREQELANLISAATTVDELDLINVNGNWPE